MRRFVEMWRLPAAAMEPKDHRHVLGILSHSFAAPEQFVERVETIYASQPPETHDVLETLDGRTIERSTRMQIVDGRNIGRVWNFREVTERKRAEQALRDETRILEILHQTGKTIASELDLQTVVQAVTDAATQLSKAQFGAFFYNVTNQQGESFLLYTLSGAPREAFEKFGLPRNTPVFDPTFRGTSPVRSADITKEPFYGQMSPHHGMPKGHLPVRSYLAAPVISRSGEVIGGLFFGHPETGVFTEQTERLVVGIAAQAAIAIDNARLYDDVRRLAEERESLLESERTARAETQRVSLMKDEFLANLSHELRTPLNAILGWSQVIASGRATEADLKQGMETIQRNAREQARLIEDLLDVSRIVSGKVRLDVQETDLSVVVQQALDSVRPSAEAKGIRLRQIIDPSIARSPAIRAGCSKWYGICLSNAVKFTPKGGKVDVISAARELAHRNHGDRLRHRHRARVLAVSVRAFSPGRFVDDAHAQRARARSVDRETARRAARGLRSSAEPRREQGSDVHRPPAARPGALRGGPRASDHSIDRRGPARDHRSHRRPRLGRR